MHSTLPRTWRRLLLSFGIVSSLAVSAMAAESYTPNEIAAALFARNARLQVQESLGLCAQVQAYRSSNFRYAEYFWQVDNRAELLATEAIWPAISEQQKRAALAQHERDAAAGSAAFNSADAAGRNKICNARWEDEAAGRTGIAARSADYGLALRKVFERTPGLLAARRAADMQSGCMMSVMMRTRVQFDAAVTSCECATKAVMQTASGPEVDEWIKTGYRTAVNKDDISFNMPLFRPIAPEIKACLAGNPK
jgi:hypothetical protein